MPMWNPWRGCRRFSEGCRFCYIHKGDAKRGVDTSLIVKTDQFDAPIRKNAKGDYRMKGGQLVYLCFSADFLIEDADAWRDECWSMMRERSDLTFLFLTKRVERLAACLPKDWGGGYENVIIGCTVENQEAVDRRLPLFHALPVKHRNIILQPLLEAVSIKAYLKGVELVVVGGESDREARPFHFEWALDIREQCMEKGIPFQFRQCGTHFVKEGKEYVLPVQKLCAQARKAGINWPEQASP